jgi:hypothetical protein
LVGSEGQHIPPSTTRAPESRTRRAVLKRAHSQPDINPTVRGRPGRDRRVLEGAAEPDLFLESGVVSGGRAHPSRSWRWAPALAVHGAFLAAVVAVPLLLPDDLPSPVTGAKVFFVQAMAPPPPPAPLAPRRAAAPSAVRPSASATRAATPAPDVTRLEMKPEDVIEPAAPALAAAALDEGVPGGVDEGVPGGIVGGVIEKVSASEPVSPRCAWAVPSGVAQLKTSRPSIRTSPPGATSKACDRRSRSSQA